MWMFSEAVQCRCLLEMYSVYVWWSCIMWLFSGAAQGGCLVELYSADV